MDIPRKRSVAKSTQLPDTINGSSPGTHMILCDFFIFGFLGCIYPRFKHEANLRAKENKISFKSK